jgi:hypothetical protein
VVVTLVACRSVLGAQGATIPAHATATSADYSGTIALTDWQPPDSGEFGGALLQRFWSQVSIQVKLIFVVSSGVNGLFADYQDGGVMARRPALLRLHPGVTEYGVG